MFKLFKSFFGIFCLFYFRMFFYRVFIIKSFPSLFFWFSSYILFYSILLKRYLFDVRYFDLKGIKFPSGNFPRVSPQWQLSKCAISQAATSQVCFCRSGQPIAFSSRSARPQAHPSAVLATHYSLRRLRRPNLTLNCSFGKLLLRKGFGKDTNNIFTLFFAIQQMKSLTLGF